MTELSSGVAERKTRISYSPSGNRRFQVPTSSLLLMRTPSPNERLGDSKLGAIFVTPAIGVHNITECPLPNCPMKAALPLSLIDGPLPKPVNPPVGVSAATLNL